MGCRSSLEVVSHSREPPVGRPYNRTRRQLAKNYLPSFPVVGTPTTKHLQMVHTHWHALVLDHKGHETRGAGTATSSSPVGVYDQDYPVAPSPKAMNSMNSVFVRHVQASPSLQHLSQAASEWCVPECITASLRALLASDKLANSVTEVVRACRRFQVHPEDFDALAIAVICMIKELSVSSWSPTLDTAWRCVCVYAIVLVLEMHLHPRRANANGGKSLPNRCIPLMCKYLPRFNLPFTSTPIHREIANDHWNKLFHESLSLSSSAVSDSNDSSRTRSHVDALPSTSQPPSTTQPVSQTRDGLNVYDVFINHVEAHMPELKDVFQNSAQVRSKMVLHTISGVRTLLSSNNISARVVDLARMHVLAGVQLEHYNQFGLALMHALKECSGDEWRLEVEIAWCRLYAHCAALLLLEHDKLLKQSSKVQSKNLRRSSTVRSTHGSTSSSP